MKFTVDGIDCTIYDGDICIIDSYKIANIYYFCIHLKEKLDSIGYVSKRDTFSWFIEIKAHNRLYKLGLFRSHTKDTDLEEDESKLRLFLYRIIAI